MSDVKEILDFEIYPRLDRAITVKELNPQDKGSYYLVECPECHQKEAYLYKDSAYITCNRRNKCGYSISLWEYIQNKNQFDNYETLKELAILANYTLPKRDGYSYEKAEKSREHANIFEAALNYFTAHLLTEEGKEALEYLLNRGYTEGEIEAMELGFYPSQEGLEDYLLNKDNPDNKTYLASEIRDIGLKTTGFGSIYKMTIPYRDPVGRLKGFIVRSLLPENELKELGVRKYKYNWGLKLDTLFNLHKARGEKNLVVVESFLDALIATQRGIRGVVAVGRDSITKPQLENVIHYGVKSFTLCFDNDPKAGPEGTERSLKLINENDLKAYVVTLPDGYKDPDELIKAQSIDAFKELIANAQSGVKWRVYQLGKQYDLNTDMGKSIFVEKALELDASLPDHRAIEGQEIIEIIKDKTGYNEEALLLKLDYKKEKQKEKKFIDKLQRHYQEGINLLGRDNFEPIEEHLKKGDEIRREYLKTQIIPTINLGDHLREKYEREKNRDPNKLLGHNLTKLSETAKKIDGIQPGLYILGADTNIGKTAFLTNIFLDLIESNPDLKGIYFSLDDNKDIIINRFLSIKTQIDLNRVQKAQVDPETRAILENQYNEFIKLWESGRLDIKDISEINHIDALEEEIRARTDKDMFVCIDGLYNVEVGAGYPGQRELNIDRANRVKALVDTYRIPIITTAELRKEKSGKNNKPTINDLMETGKFGYNANIVWLLYPEDREDFKEANDPILHLDFDKNKLSHYKGYIELKFTKSKGIIEESIKKANVDPLEF